MQGVLLHFKILGSCIVATLAIKYNGFSHMEILQVNCAFDIKDNMSLQVEVGKSELGRPQRAHTQLYFVPCLRDRTPFYFSCDG
jgi:hypothetical protein